MALSPEIYQRLYEQQNVYAENAAVQRQVSSKAFLAIIGPSGIGKSSLMNEMVAQNPEYARVSGFTNRGVRPNDEPGLYRYLTTDEDERAIIEKIDNGEVVQYAVHPTTHKLYGSEVSDYPGAVNLLDTLSGAVEGLWKLPFAWMKTVGLVAEPEVWREWFMRRYPKPSSEAGKRLEEGRISLQWLQDQPPSKDLIIIKNKPGALATVATDLAAMIEQPDLNMDKASVAALLHEVESVAMEYAS